ncbi:MAG: hypothetical protein COT71_00450 [Candidatus Andersenbacteria bacterium CG10_big_fil_rev_8_21_14_0_10_54_11]|uniref:EamA domain-containing protein n=1 Tax=Candidatus Andersenbacteria bacterium CG10_big_fil_rev_8_21_14_0_10_54_11 TaxID=1974485 RepID=A0A2M6X0I1_9BACT|nr:MAG: hypothetical protein COT71_00450 [Candidatus Andersenbacteria bacterium CG10_big_fil_rev_8_21_14_0_10_54_11]
MAMAAHALNAFVFVIDKTILGVQQAEISRPARYAAYSGLTAGAAGGLLLVSFTPPTSLLLWQSAAAGATWVAALWLFFRGLKAGEPSRVVPVAGAAVPLFTLIFAAGLLGEQLGGEQLLGVVGLIAGGGLLSVRLRGGRGLPPAAASAAVLSGAAFAAHFAVMDAAYAGFFPFITIFAYTRLGVAAAALLLWLLLRLLQSHDSVAGLGNRGGLRSRRAAVAAAFFTGKGIGTAALLLQNYAIYLGSVTVVNALQGFQYVFLLMLAAGISRVRPRYFREEWSRVAAWQKIGGVVLVGIGLALVL